MSKYSKVFDNTNPNWKEDDEFNHIFIQAQQNYMNHRLKVHGYVFLNEVYEALGFKRTSDGQLVGWLAISDLNDIKFDLEHFKNKGVLDFNVDGVIYDKI